MMPYRAVLFDLDGTLLDTLEDIADAANAVLRAHGFPPHPAESYRQFIGSGVEILFRRALHGHYSLDGDWVDRCCQAFREAYGTTWDVHTRPFHGIPELLDALTARGLALGILSNKPDHFTRLCVERYFSNWPIGAVLGERDGIPRKPDPAGAMEISRLLHVPPHDFLYVGDTSVDMETARRAGMTPVGVAWGFRPVEELLAAGASTILNDPGELLDLVDRSPGT